MFSRLWPVALRARRTRVVRTSDTSPRAPTNPRCRLEGGERTLCRVRVPRSVARDALPRRSDRFASRARPVGRLSKQAIGDDSELNLARPLEDLGEARVTPVALDGVQLRVPGAAENLQRIGTDAFGHLRCVPLHHRGFFVEAAPIVELRRDVVHQLARGFDLARHARNLESSF